MTQDPHGAHADGPQNGSLNGRLDGWKEIAAVLRWNGKGYDRIDGPESK